MVETLPKIDLPSHYNYVGVFLTLGCNLTCSYCINHLSGKLKPRAGLKAQDWINGLNRINFNGEALSLTLQGGEPTLHPEFYKILNGIETSLEIELLTNIQFSPKEFCENVSPSRFSKISSYAPIRVSYHPETMNLDETLLKVSYLLDRGFNVGLFSVKDARFETQLLEAQEKSKLLGIDFRLKELLGEINGELLGTYRYKDAVAATELKKCLCKTSEFLIAPDGSIHRCHHDLYNRILPIGHILDEDFKVQDIFRECNFYGKCNPCDIKIKNNRHQLFGHTSVEITNVMAFE